MFKDQVQFFLAKKRIRYSFIQQEGLRSLHVIGIETSICNQGVVGGETERDMSMRKDYTKWAQGC
jgi:hypothetical protein